jgi:DNA-binding LytR/AlgR family response regulator
MLNCIIVDDDEIAILAINQLVKNHGLLNVIKTFQDPSEALQFLEERKDIDLMFLDIEMPELDGLSFMRNNIIEPQIIVVSSKREYAAEAFDFNVTDFLSKPIDRARFEKAINRVKEIQLSLRKSKTQNSTEDLYIKKDNQLIHINERDILYLEAMADYIKIYCSDKQKYTILSTMKSAENKLNRDNFVRIHRSYIIRLEKIKVIEDETVSIGDVVLPISRGQKPLLFQKLNLF